ncbi:dTDP-4-dehydrorhamnose 3,5-epimerase family protein [Bradyrhizobium guangdongense]|uniref:dTDP-4-dehydrorhamnose 3,5-epimerase n=1 Tax=Bradyrhizobium guangdongense TaxID=1325090 RepID=A0ABX6UEA0_9BRAD|nr:hypothetical protein X265_12970 [Bradyrhizobium guangdongense]QOZ59542.1 hypothetical protein XH86_12970 [Bradyrhizobium guangdongense]
MPGKLVSVLKGRILDVAADVRVGSSTLGRHVAFELNDKKSRQLCSFRFTSGDGRLVRLRRLLCKSPYGQ